MLVPEVDYWDRIEVWQRSAVIRNLSVVLERELKPGRFPRDWRKNPPRDCWVLHWEEEPFLPLE